MDLFTWIVQYLDSGGTMQHTIKIKQTGEEAMKEVKQSGTNIIVVGVRRQMKHEE